MEEVSRENYIPGSAIDSYREALAKEYRRLKDGESGSTGELSIRILGKACAT